MRCLLFFLLLLPATSFANEVECLAKNIYFESRGEPTAGQLAVGFVTLNRVKSKKFPNTICEVVYQAKYLHKTPIRNKCQFSWYCDGYVETIRDLDAYKKATNLANYLVYSAPIDITEGALFYHSLSVDPYWNKSVDRVLLLGNHIFYK